MNPIEFSLDDISIGQNTSVERIISSEDIEIFRQLSGQDRSPIHTDREYALVHGFKNKLAYGAMLGALLSELVGMKLPGRNSMCLTQSFEFKKPFYAGDELKLIGTVVAKSVSTRLIELSLVVTRGEEIVATGNACVLMLN